MEITGGQGHYVGDHGIQINLFGDRRPSGPVVAGSVPQPPPAFRPRAELMARLREAGPGVSVVHAVTGLRGVGKTQLAAAYARECIDAGWRLVAWVNAEDTGLALSGLEVVASRLGIDRPGTTLEAIGAEVRNRIEADGDRCLIVFDNVTDPGALRPYLPSAGRCQVIVTSTQASAEELGEPTEVAVFTERESLDFLAERTGLGDQDGAGTLAAELGHLPLALAQAAAVIRARRLSYPVYLARLRSYPAERYLPRAASDSYPRGVAESILLSADTVTAADDTGLCADLLGVISLLSPHGVPRDLLYLGEPGDVFGANQESVDEALARLAEASLLTFGGDASSPAVIAHRLVMRVIRERDARGENGTGRRALALLARYRISLGQPWQNRAAARDFVRQATALPGQLGPGPAAADDQQLLTLRTWAVWCLVELGDSPAQTVRLAERHASDCQRLLGPSHADTLTARSYLASAHRVAGQADVAVSLYEELVADCERLLGATRPATLSARNNLASAYWAAGQAGPAVALFEAVLADREHVLGATHPNTLTTLSNLALAYEAAGRLSDAVPLLERVLAERAAALGKLHPATLKSRCNLALVFADLGRLGEALPMFEQVLDDRLRVLGELHPDTLMSRNDLAGVYRAAGRLSEAIPLYQQALAGAEQVLGAANPATGTIRANLAAARGEDAPGKDEGADPGTGAGAGSDAGPLD